MKKNIYKKVKWNVKNKCKKNSIRTSKKSEIDNV